MPMPGSTIVLQQGTASLRSGDERRRHHGHS